MCCRIKCNKSNTIDISLTLIAVQRQCLIAERRVNQEQVVYKTHKLEHSTLLKIDGFIRPVSYNGASD
jgi:hypothetical protein